MLTIDQIAQAARIRYMAESVKSEDIRPISAQDDDTMRASRAAGLAVWNTREAFVVYFSATDHTFGSDEADEFRRVCQEKHSSEQNHMQAWRDMFSESR